MELRNKNELVEDLSGEEVQSVFNKKVIIKGVLWLALITIATIAGVFFFTNGHDTLKALSHISPKYILLAIVMLSIDLMLGSWRNHIFIRKLYPHISHWVSFRANVANVFMGAVTPAHGGAGPAQMYVYHKNGVTFIDAFAISLINWGATLVFMPLAGLMAIIFMDTSSISGIIPTMLKYGFSFFAIFLAIFFLAFWKPIWIGRVIQKIASYLSRFFPGKRTKLISWGDKSFTSIVQYQETCSVILKKHPFLFPLALVITIILYLNKYVLQFVLLLGLGVNSNLIQVISVQVLIQFMIYFAQARAAVALQKWEFLSCFQRSFRQKYFPYSRSFNAPFYCSSHPS